MKKIAGFVAFFALIIQFQNCGGGFESIETSSIVGSVNSNSNNNIGIPANSNNNSNSDSNNNIGTPSNSNNNSNTGSGGNSGGNATPPVDTSSNYIPSTYFDFKTQSQAVMKQLKYKSCMFNGLVYPGVEDEANYLAMLQRSQCEILPRSIETWTKAPDFVVIKNKINQINTALGKKYRHGIFIAEAISTAEIYRDDKGQIFNFKSMCRPGTENHWGPDTCVPSTENAEYVRYLRYIVQKSIEVGVEEVLFGQADYQDASRVLDDLVLEFKAIASQAKKPLIIGFQPNRIPSTAQAGEVRYWKTFDYVLGPNHVGKSLVDPCNKSGSIGGECDGVNLLHAYPRGIANEIIVEFDWNSNDDDIHRFARMTAEKKKDFMRQRIQRATELNIGFIMPFREPLNGGSKVVIDSKSFNNCYGYNEWVYSADKRYSCNDEDLFNSILQSWSNFAYSAKSLNSVESCEILNTSSPMTGAKDKIEYLYCVIFRRAPSSAEIQFYIKTGRGPRQIANEFWYSDELKKSLGSFEQLPVDRFVREVFLRTLNRAPSSNDLNFYRSKIQNQNVSYVQILNEILSSDEFKIVISNIERM